MMKFNLHKWGCCYPQSNDETSPGKGGLHDNVFTGKPELEHIPPMVKRRMPMVAKAMAFLDDQLGSHSLPAVYASKDAEISRTLKLIRQFDQDLSPAMFSMSVNNAIPGLLSVNNKNNLPYTVVDSMSGILAMAFLEAFTMLSDYPKVKVMLFEEQSSSESQGKKNEPCRAFGFVLTRGESLSVKFVPQNNDTAYCDVDDFTKWERFFNRKDSRMIQYYQRQQWQWQWH